MTRKITALKVQKRNPQRVNVYLDGEFAFGLNRLVAAWLRVGQQLSEAKIASLRAQDAREQAYLRALNLLSYRDRSLQEIRQNLKKHQTPEDVIDEVLQRLQEEGYANDTRFARLWVENRNTFRPRGRRVLAMELRRKGVAPAVIEDILRENEPEETLALRAGRQRARRYAALDWPAFRRKLTAFLARRGFAYSVVAPVVQQLWQELHESGVTTEEDVDL